MIANDVLDHLLMFVLCGLFVVFTFFITSLLKKEKCDQFVEQKKNLKENSDK